METENRGFFRCLCYLLFKTLKTMVHFSQLLVNGNPPLDISKNTTN